jgi:hypothetical protein
MLRVTMLIMLGLVWPTMAQTLCPPAQWDFPYKGKLTVHQVDHNQIVVHCRANHPFSGMIAGCAYPGRGACTVYINSSARDPACALRHEIAHCNGWPSHHP